MLTITKKSVQVLITYSQSIEKAHASKNFFTQLFEANTVRIFKNMIVPLLMHTNEEIEEMTEDPREFY